MRIRSVDAGLAPAGSGAATGLVLVLTGLCFAVYAPAWTGDLIFDDATYVGIDASLPAGEALGRIWLGGPFPDYYPLTRTGLWIEAQLWGTRTAGYHAVNLTLHALNALLVWQLLARLGIPIPWLAGLVFALHPVQVQSVAWIAQRKTLLAASFFLASLIAYLEFDRRPRRQGWYAASCTLFALALLSKTTAIVLPAAALLLVWWRRRGLQASDWTPVLPLIVLALPFALHTAQLEARNPVAVAGPEADALARLAGAGRALWFYAGKALWPRELCFVYPHWTLDTSRVVAFLPALAAAGIAGVAFRLRHGRGRAVFAVLAWYAMGLAPVLGLARFGHLRFAPVADHYQYLSLAALGAALACAAAWLWRRAPGVPGRSLLAGALGMLLAACAALTWHQASLYRDRETIWLDTLAKVPSSWLAHNNLGAAYYQRGDHERAARHFASSFSLEPDPRTRGNLGLAQLALGQLESARQQFEGVLRAAPDHAEAAAGLAEVHRQLGLRLVAEGRGEAARHHFREAERLRSGSPPGTGDATNP